MAEPRAHAEDQDSGGGALVGRPSGNMNNVFTAILPPSQRRSAAEMDEALDLYSGDRKAKLSAFWTMLALSAVIAVAGLLADSTATVIGAMIIAPLSTPIMGMALGIVRTDRRLVLRSAGVVAAGVGAAIVTGALLALPLPSSLDTLGNDQIMGRTSPGILDMVAAVATGLAGAIGLARKDVSAILPGVAIAISLVPPLGVVGICLGQGRPLLALGALILFLSNMVALVLAGTLVFTAYGFALEAARDRGLRRRRSNAVIGVTLLLVLLPLAANTAGNLAIAAWTARVRTVAEEWVTSDPAGRVTGVTVTSTTAVVQVEVSREVPDPAALLAALDGVVPDGISVVVDAGVGEWLEVGTVGRA